MLIEYLTLDGRLVTLDDQTLYVFQGLRAEFQPLVARLTRGAPVSLTELSDFLVLKNSSVRMMLAMRQFLSP